MDKILQINTIGAVRVLTMNRPERLNALDTPLLQALNDAFAAVAEEDHIRAVLLAAAGRGFCAGADLLQLAGDDEVPDLGPILEALYNPLVRRMRDLAKPVVCAVNGVAAGAGMSLALAGDLVIAARCASFSQGFARIGLLPDAGSTFLLPRIIGDARARGMAMLGETISATQAQAWGLIWQMVEDDGFAAEALTLATNLAAMPAGAMAAIKQALNASWEQGLAAQLGMEREFQQKLGQTADFAEGLRAFRERRPPVFNAGGRRN